MRLLFPVCLFAATLAVLEWCTTGRLSTLPLRTVGVAAVTVLVARIVPWAKFIAVTPPRTRRFQLALFVLFTMHFARTVSEEARRMMIARRISVPRTFGPGAFCSLQWAVAGVFRRSLTRAERFYGAQVMKGLGD